MTNRQVIPKSEITMTTWPTGTKVHHFEPKPEEFNILDIAHHLSLICRFMGGVPWLYSVGQHSIHCVDVLLSFDPDATPQEQMHTLLHDATDAYWGDLHSQAKRKVRGYQKAYKTMEQVIWKKFGLAAKEPYKVKVADGVMLSTELHKLKNAEPHIRAPLYDFKIPRWSPGKTKKEFLKRYEQIRDTRISTGDFVLVAGT